MNSLLVLSNSSAIIQNNTRLENNVLWGVYKIWYSSTFQLNNVAFIRNKLWWSLLDVESNSSAIIQNSIILENNLSYVLYNIWYSSTIQLNYVAFTRNKLTVLLRTRKCCSAIIWNNTLLNTLLKNNISIGLYHLLERSTMQLNNVTFTRNKLR